MKSVTNSAAVLLLSILFLGLTTQCEMAPGLEEEMAVVETTNGVSAACAPCDHIVNSYVTDGKLLNIKPGDVICLDAAETYNRLVFRNIVGTKNSPVVIQNCGGVAKIYSDNAFGLKFQHSKNFKLVGKGSSAKYGIKVTTEKGFYITMEQFTTDFEIANVEVAGATAKGLGDRAGFAGIGIKTSPYQDCGLFTDPTREAWVMRNISVHHNYIHDVGGEGLYIGHGFYRGRKESKCSKVTYSHSIRGLKIYRNLIENVGYDGMQIKNADQNVMVYRNTIRNYGTKDVAPHNEGLFIGEGTTGRFFKNTIDTGTGNGCQLQGLGKVLISNNLFLNSGENGIYATYGNSVVRLENGYFNIFNNTIYNSKKVGFVFYNDAGGNKRFHNNLVVKAGELTRKGATVDLKNNIFTNNVGSIRFVNIAGRNFRLKAGSQAINKGINLSKLGVKSDFDGKRRLIGAYDVGAFEFGSL